jgi:hypothetical protein
MSSRIVNTTGSKILIELEIDLTGSMLEMEEHIQAVLNEAGRISTKAAIEQFDTNGEKIVLKGKSYSSKGQKKAYQYPLWSSRNSSSCVSNQSRREDVCSL